MSNSIASGMTHPQANAAEQSRMELQAKLNGLGGLNGRKLDPEAKAKKLREACEGFESIFIQKMWQEMRNAVPKTGLLSGREEKFWQDMYDQELSKSMTKAGGIGLADMMYEQLSRNLVSASKGAAQGGAQGAFTPSAAPLVTTPMPEIYEASAAETAQSRPMPSIYEGEAPVQATEVAEQAVPAQPVQTPERRHGLVHAPTQTRQPGSAESTLSGNSGIDLAYRAKREAGDKLSANAVRPAMQPRAARQSKQAAAAQAPVQETAQAHGTETSLQAALELAKTGGAAQPQQSGMALSEIVAQVKARNASAANTVISSTGMSQTSSVVATAQAPAQGEPVTRKTTFTTNIPANAKNRKAGNNAIRMLNVDNVSVNSNQGKGLAAYHAAQAAQPVQSAQAANAVQDVQPVNASQQPVMGALPPLSPEKTEPASFAIPPLTPGTLSSSL